MSTEEFWWEFDYNFESQQKLKANQPGAAGFTHGEWAAARKAHKEKMNGQS